MNGHRFTAVPLFSLLTGHYGGVAILPDVIARDLMAIPVYGEEDR